MHKRSSGITIIELLVVIVVVGILATIATLGFGQYQASVRDAQRAASATAISEALEQYFEDNGEYPGCSKFNTTGEVLVTQTLPGLDQRSLMVPTPGNSPTEATNSLKCSSEGLTIDGQDFFEYVGDGSNTCIEGPACLSYTLRYKQETENSIASITGRYDASLSSSGAPHLSLDEVSFSEISLVWTEVPNSLSYTVQKATNSSFSSGLTTHSTEDTSISIDGLEEDTSYYFRARAVSSGGNSPWSNVRTAKTLKVGVPTVTATTTSTTSINVTWGAVDYADKYTLRYSVNSNFSGATTINNITTTSQALTGLTIGERYYIQVRATVSDRDGGWSSTKQATTNIGTPTITGVTSSTPGSITVTWGAVAGANNYRLEYSASSDFSSPTQVNGLTSTSNTRSGYTQGTEYFFRVFAYTPDKTSDASAVESGASGVTAPGAPGVSARQAGEIRNGCSPYTGWILGPTPGCPNQYYATGWITSSSCPSGTSAIYQFKARYNSPTTEHTSSASTRSQWYFVNARSGYYTMWSARYYCQGQSVNSSWGPWSSYVRAP